MSSGVYEEGTKLRLGPNLAIELSALREQSTRASGPGGQNVNKVSTAVELWAAVDAVEGLDEHGKNRLRNLAGHKLTKSDEIQIRCEDTRSQRDNRQTARERLAELVRRAAVRPKVRRKTKPSRGSVRRRLQAKKENSEKKQRPQRVND